MSFRTGVGIRMLPSLLCTPLAEDFTKVFVFCRSFSLAGLLPYGPTGRPRPHASVCESAIVRFHLATAEGSGYTACDVDPVKIAFQCPFLFRMRVSIISAVAVPSTGRATHSCLLPRASLLIRRRPCPVSTRIRWCRATDVHLHGMIAPAQTDTMAVIVRW